MKTKIEGQYIIYARRHGQIVDTRFHMICGGLWQINKNVYDSPFHY